MPDQSNGERMALFPFYNMLIAKLSFKPAGRLWVVNFLETDFSGFKFYLIFKVSIDALYPLVAVGESVVIKFDLSLPMTFYSPGI